MKTTITHEWLRDIARRLEGLPPERQRCELFTEEGRCPEEPVESLVPIYGDGFPAMLICRAHLDQALAEGVFGAIVR